MKFQFDGEQPHQKKAIEAIVHLFDGQESVQGQHTGYLPSSRQRLLLPGQYVANQLTLGRDVLLQNVRHVQKRQGLPESPDLGAAPSFTLEMETGTGKTYTYLRTIYELHTRYGWSKFIIIVPSIAIREGVMKNIKLTHQHLQSLYGAPKAEARLYKSKQLNIVKQFAASHALQLLVMNIQAFEKADNIINTQRELGFKPVEYLRLTRPILILDEPQKMATEKRAHALKALQPSFALRYSATHKKLENLVYRLDPVQAYNQGLVKKIEVLDVLDKDNQNMPFVHLKAIQPKKNTIQVSVELQVATAKGIAKKRRTLKRKADLYKVSGELEMYKGGYLIEAIDAEKGHILLNNGLRMEVGQSIGGPNEDLLYAQIKNTIKEHLDKEKKLLGKGIKVLSLFFLDKVSNYRTYTEKGAAVPGPYARWFEALYKELSQDPKYADLPTLEARHIHDGYFAKDKKGRFKDTKGESQDDRSTYALIMRDKERLLDPKEPLRFIFSHSALREGWDNPNVFQICTLQESTSVMKKRQEIGRGMRLAVDHQGRRITDPQINRLTLIVNESYEAYARSLQKEIEQECGVAFEAANIKNKKKRTPLPLRKGFQADPRFLAIWDKIKQKTTYDVDYDTEEFTAKAGTALQEELEKVRPPRLQKRKVSLDMNREEGVHGLLVSEGEIDYHRAYRYRIPHVVRTLQKATGLTRTTLAGALAASGQADKFFINPRKALQVATEAIKKTLQHLMLDGLQYTKVEDAYRMEIFDPHLEDYLEDFHFAVHRDKTIHERYIPLDSKVEAAFAQECNKMEQVLFYFKLPHDFTIPTPIGTYNPDWAVLWQEDGMLNEKAIYFVAETKGSTDKEELRPREDKKAACGEKHFQACAQGVKFALVSSYKDLADRTRTPG